MALKGSDREFRLEKLSYIDFKPLNMDRVLTMLFPGCAFAALARGGRHAETNSRSEILPVNTSRTRARSWGSMRIPTWSSVG